MNKRAFEYSIASLVSISIGGLLLHAVLHPVSSALEGDSNPAFFVPLVAGFLSVTAVPILLSLKRTFLLGYLINGMTAVIGTIAMVVPGISHLPAKPEIGSILLDAQIPSAATLLAKLLIGQAILRYYHPNGTGRLFTLFFWARHLVYLSVVFYLGSLLWR